MSSRTGTQREATRPAPRLRRAYYECRYGQLHLHNAIPAGGGFDELTPVICLHATGETGTVFLPALSLLGLQRSAYALDLPGAGGSDPAPDVAPVDAAANAVADFIDNMRIRSCDVIARGAAAAAALQLLQRHGDALRRVLLVDPPGGIRGGAKLAVLTEAQATPARLAELLTHPA